MTEPYSATVKSRIKDNPYFFGMYFLFLILGYFILLNINKGDCVIYFNDMRGTYLDDVFRFFSSLGEGIQFAVFLIIAGVFRIKYLFNGLMIYFIPGIVSQLMKNIFKIPRPKAFFEGSDLVTYVDGFELFSHNSFPSGHTTSGFAIFLFLSLITPYKPLGIFYFVMALLVGISRVYLVQHFLIDVYFGSMVGVFAGMLTYNYIENNPKISSSKWYNFSIYEAKFKTKI